MRVFITGASGFIGGTLAARYRSDGHQVRGVDQAADGGNDIVAGDVSRSGPWQDHVAGCELVINTAALVNNTSPWDECWAVNVAGLRRTIDAAVAGGADRVVHFSSVRAFSDLDFPDGVDEQHPVRTDGHRYVDTKVASEQVALQAHAAGEVDVTVIRPGDVYGPGSMPWTIWPLMGMQQAMFAIPAEPGLFSPVYVDNLVDAVVAAARLPEAAGQVITVTDGVAIDNAEFFGRYAAMLGVELLALPTDQLRTLFDSVGVGAETADYFLRQGTYANAKARSLLGWEPVVDLDDGMARIETWARSTGLIPS
ncbi:MAG: NAD(P)-dependent oxidoreductase [Acidimicrobiia bacterium]|nr:NAD(P)-dependent oxidoreductase [Acidimicrobiia bacterium]